MGVDIIFLGFADTKACGFPHKYTTCRSFKQVKERKLKMKRILCALLSVSLVIGILSLSACKKKKGDGASNDASNNNPGEVNTFVDLEHSSPITPDGTDTLEETEIKTEATTAAQTEQTTEEVTEAETEKAPEPVVIKSLKFTSYGNGTCTVSGIGDITDLCVIIPEKSPEGDIVTSIDSAAFYGNQTIKTVQIPSTVTRIGERAFGNCTSLVYISVDTSNIVFCDIAGVLYSADLTTLIHYPAASGSIAIEIPSSLKRIADMAFYNCDNLREIVYDGSYEGWGKIEVGELNYGIISASVSCLRGGK